MFKYLFKIYLKFMGKSFDLIKVVERKNKIFRECKSNFFSKKSLIVIERKLR